MDTRKKWQWREENGETRVLENMQQLGKRKIDESFVNNNRIEYLSEFDLDAEGNKKELRWIPFGSDFGYNLGKERNLLLTVAEAEAIRLHCTRRSV